MAEALYTSIMNCLHSPRSLESASLKAEEKSRPFSQEHSHSQRSFRMDPVNEEGLEEDDMESLAGSQTTGMSLFTGKDHHVGEEYWQGGSSGGVGGGGGMHLPASQEAQTSQTLRWNAPLPPSSSSSSALSLALPGLATPLCSQTGELSSLSGGASLGAVPSSAPPCSSQASEGRKRKCPEDQEELENDEEHGGSRKRFSVEALTDQTILRLIGACLSDPTFPELVSWCVWVYRVACARASKG